MDYYWLKAGGISIEINRRNFVWNNILFTQNNKTLKTGIIATNWVIHRPVV